MYRFPPRRYPRVAALCTAKGCTTLVVLDPWEVRTAVLGATAPALRRALLRERPTVVATAAVPAWLQRLRFPVLTVEKPVEPASLSDFPELRRFVGTRFEPSLGRALALADHALSSPWP